MISLGEKAPNYDLSEFIAGVWNAMWKFVCFFLFSDNRRRNMMAFVSSLNAEAEAMSAGTDTNK